LVGSSRISRFDGRAISFASKKPRLFAARQAAHGRAGLGLVEQEILEIATTWRVWPRTIT
jgi:hypothetical protein